MGLFNLLFGRMIDRRIAEYQNDLITVDTVLKTGNIMIDAILNSKLSLIQSKNINVNAKATVPPSLNVSEVDLCAMIGICCLFDHSCQYPDHSCQFIILQILRAIISSGHRSYLDKTGLDNCPILFL